MNEGWLNKSGGMNGDMRRSERAMCPRIRLDLSGLNGHSQGRLLNTAIPTYWRRHRFVRRHVRITPSLIRENSDFLFQIVLPCPTIPIRPKRERRWRRLGRRRRLDEKIYCHNFKDFLAPDYSKLMPCLRSLPFQVLLAFFMARREKSMPSGNWAWSISPFISLSLSLTPAVYLPHSTSPFSFPPSLQGIL